VKENPPIGLPGQQKQYGYQMQPGMSSAVKKFISSMQEMAKNYPGPTNMSPSPFKLTN
jgi:hypothetical protein